jgi:hypothetical protein
MMSFSDRQLGLLLLFSLFLVDGRLRASRRVTRPGTRYDVPGSSGAPDQKTACRPGTPIAGDELYLLFFCTKKENGPWLSDPIITSYWVIPLEKYFLKGCYFTALCTSFEFVLSRLIKAYLTPMNNRSVRGDQ